MAFFGGRLLQHITGKSTVKNEQDDFSFESLAVFEADNDWVIGPGLHVDSPPEPEVIEPEAPGNEKGPGAASDHILLTARLKAGSVSMMETVEDGQHRQRRRSIRVRFASLEVTIERSDR